MNRILPFVFFLVLAIIFVAIAVVISEPNMRIFLASRDFRNHYTGALLIRHGETSRFYNIDTQYKMQRTFIPELSDRRRLMPFNRPPLVALLLSPLAAFPFTQAYRIFTIINLFLLGLSLFITWLIFSNLPDVKKRDLIAPYIPYVFIVFACFVPVWITLLQGQFSYLLFLIFYAIWYFSSREEDMSAGLSMALLMVFPQLLIVPFFFFLILRKFKMLLWSIVGLCAFVVVSILTIGIEGVMNYPRFLLFLSNAGETYTMYPRDEPTLRSLLHILFRTDYPNTLILILWVAASAALFYVLVKIYHPVAKHSGTYSIAFATMMAITMLSSAHTNYHDLMLILLAFFLYIRGCIELYSAEKIRNITMHKHLILIALSLGVFAFSMVAYWYPQMVPVMIFAVYLYYRLRRKPNSRNFSKR